MSPRLGDLFLTSQSDERLVSLARGGHERVFAVIVERYRPQLLAQARRLSSDGKGEDIVQQAFLSAFAALRSGAEVRHLRGWLYQILRNAATRNQAPVLVPLEETTAGGETLEEIVQQRATAIGALTEMARLPSRQRQAIVGTALDGRPRAEIAGAMGLSEGAVRQLVHRARAQLRTVVTAVTPWPLARWFAGSGGTGNGSAVDVAASVGAGAASSGGVALKLGALLATGTLATGAAVVDSHDGGRPHRTTARVARVGVAHTAHSHSGRGVGGGGGGATRIEFAAATTVAAVHGGLSSAGSRAVGAVAGSTLERRGGEVDGERPDRGRAGGGGSGGGSGGGGGGGGGGPSDSGRGGSASVGDDGGARQVGGTSGPGPSGGPGSSNGSGASSGSGGGDDGGGSSVAQTGGGEQQPVAQPIAAAADDDTVSDGGATGEGGGGSGGGGGASGKDSGSSGEGGSGGSGVSGSSGGGSGGHDGGSESGR